MGLSSSGPGAANILYVYLAVAFPLMMTVFHHRTLLKKRGDYQGSLLYFAAFFVLFFAVPMLIVAVAAASPRNFLASVGLAAGRAGTGLVFIAIAVPVALLAAVIGSRDPVIRAQYPFSKEACLDLKRFVRYEIAYLCLYYLPWEFLFRGILFFPLIPAVGLVPALVLQTIISTVYHLGHPDTEIYAAAAGGFIFGLIAYATGSFLYTVIIHALFGIALDSVLCYRFYRRIETTG
jgi:membrane protease YdiL (CAAX protease family)